MPHKLIPASRAPGFSRSRTAFFLFLSVAVVLLATFLIYYPGLDGPFLVDDKQTVQNTRIDGFSTEEISEALFSRGGHTGRLGRSIPFFSFALTRYFHGLNPFDFKYENLALHCLNGLLIFWLIGRLMTTLLGADRARDAWLVAGLSATFWLLHPLMVSTVLYTVQRLAQMSALFTLAAALCYVVGRQNLNRNVTLARAQIFLGTGFFGILGVFSKEDAALLPFYLLLIEVFFFRFAGQSRTETRTVWAAITVFVAAPVLIGTVYFLTHASTLLDGYDIREFSLSERLLTEARILWFYLRLILLPRLGDMSLFHDNYPISHNWDLPATLAVVGLTIGAIMAFLFRRRSPVASFGFLWFIAAHLLESTLFPLELVFEHRNYLAAAGPLVAVSYYLLIGLQRLFLSPRLPVIASVLFVGLLAFQTHTRASTWGDKELMYRVGVLDRPDSTRVRTELANIELRQGRLGAARKLLSEVTNIRPDDPGGYLHLLQTYCHTDSIPAEIYRETLNILRTGRATAYALSGISTTLQMFRKGDCSALTPSKVVRLAEAISANRTGRRQGFFYRYVFLGRARFLWGDDLPGSVKAYKKTTRYSDAVAPAVKPIPLLEMLDVQLAMGDFEGAAATYSKLLELNSSIRIDISSKLEKYSGKVRVKTSLPSDGPP